MLQTNPDIAQRFLECIELGMTIKASCDYAGIEDDTFFLWQRKAQEDLDAGKTSRSSQYIRFINEFKKSQSKCQQKHLKVIQKASEHGSWQASAWILERRFPETFALKNQVDMTDTKIVVVNDVVKDGNEQD